MGHDLNWMCHLSSGLILCCFADITRGPGLLSCYLVHAACFPMVAGFGEWKQGSFRSVSGSLNLVHVLSTFTVIITHRFFSFRSTTRYNDCGIAPQAKSLL
jgi:hypothetical protein